MTIPVRSGLPAAAGRAQIEPLAGKRPEVVVPAIRVRAANAYYALAIVAIRREPFAYLLDAFETVDAVGRCILRLVVVAEVGDVAFENGMKLVAVLRKIPRCRSRRVVNCGAHIHNYKSGSFVA